jgi:hypothetical protein
MAIRTELDEIQAIVQRTMANLMAFNGMAGRSGADVRYLCGDMAVRAPVYLVNGTFAQRLLACFRATTTAGISLDWMDRVLDGLVAEKPVALTATIVVQNSLIFALAQEGRIIGATNYVSRDDVDAVMRRMKDRFDVIRDIIADTTSGPGFEAFVELTAGITRYLSDVARPLPRMLNYQMLIPLPALAITQFIYGDGSRDEEIAAENRVVHPAFCRMQIRALSA